MSPLERARSEYLEACVTHSNIGLESTRKLVEEALTRLKEEEARQDDAARDS